MKALLTFFCFLLFALNINAQEAIRLIPYKIGGKYGYSDTDKKIIIPVQYNFASPFGYSTSFSYHSDLAVVQMDYENFVINKKGEIIDKEKDFIEKNRNNFFRIPEIDKVKIMRFSIFEENGLKGIKDEKGSIIVEAQYVSLVVDNFSNTYLNEETGNYYSPTYASSFANGVSSLIRLDKPTHYKNLKKNSYTPGDNFMIVESDDNKFGILFEDEIKWVTPKHTRILHYYRYEQLLRVSKLIEGSSYTYYMDMEGNEYFE